MFSKNDSFNVDVSYNSGMADRLFDAVQNNRDDEVRDYIRDQSIKAWTIKDERGFTILHRAVFNDNGTMVNLIIEELKKRIGMNSRKIMEKFINDKNQEGITAMHYAAYKGNINIAKFLYDNGAGILFN
ncbi:MAG: ankyrin repeat domain-containing protein [archaeon]|nr:ankyrin repeat domain-containing protein [archaeon]